MREPYRATGLWRRVAAVAVATLVVLAGFATPARAVTESHWSGARQTPYIYYQKSRNTLDSKINVYVSLGRTRYRLQMRGGSGDGTRSECVSNRGQLPSGYYSPTDRDRGSTLKYLPNKNWGEPVVAGAVWQLGNKRCRPASGESAKTRTALFIHSQGRSGWTNSNYKSAGCIKINQVDRAKLAKRWAASYNISRGYLLVH